MNKVILRGNLGDDPKFNNTNTTGTAVANFRMATNKKWTDANGQKQEATEWHNVVAWKRLAEIVRDYCRKGSQVLVEAEARTREYTIVVEKQCVDAQGTVLINPQTNAPYTVNVLEKRYTTEMHVRNLELLDKAPATAAYPGGQPVVNAAGNPGAVNAQFVIPGQEAVVGQPVVPNNPVNAATAGMMTGVANAGTPATVQPVVIPGL